MLCEFGSFENLIEKTDHTGTTALLTAVKYNQAELVKILVQFNCNVFHRNSRGDTCLHMAALHSSLGVLPVLASFITEEMFTVLNRDGMSSIDVATSLRNFDFVRSLEVIKRNITVQHALTERDVQYPVHQSAQKRS